MKPGPLLKNLGGVIVAGALGFYLGHKTSEEANSSSAARAGGPAPPTIGGALAKGAAAAKQEGHSARWKGDAAALGLDQAPLTARLKRAFETGEPFGGALAVQLLGRMTAAEAPDVFDFLKTRKEANRGPANSEPPVWHAFWMSWGALAPEAALAQIERGMPTYQFSDRAEKHVFSGLAVQDLQRAATLAESRVGVVSRKWAAEGTAFRWAETDPEGATRWAMTRLEEPIQAWALKTIPWAINRREGPTQALRWWESLPPGPGRESAFGTLTEISGLSSDASIEDRTALLTAGVAQGVRSTRLELMLATQFATKDPLRGIAVLGSLPPVADDVPHRSISALVQGWAQNDPEAAGTWLVQQSGQPWGEAAIRGYASAIKRDDPEAAAKWEASLREPPGR